MTLTNKVYFKADTPYMNNGDNTDTMFTTCTVDVRPNSIYPGLKKTAYGYMTTSGDRIFEGKSGINLAPGAYLIWKLEVSNDAAAQNTMSGYTLKDVLPADYDIVSGNTVALSKSFPADLTDDEFKKGQFVKHKKDGSVAYHDYLDPTEDGTEDGRKRVKWSFNDSFFDLEPGEYIEFLLITQPKKNSSGIYYNKAELYVNDKLYEDSVNIGTVTDNKIISEDSFSINSIATSSEKRVYAVNGAIQPTAASDSENSMVTAVAGDQITYELSVKNESLTPIKNLTLIDRLPYQGDTGVLSKTLRGSDFSVKLLNIDSVKIYNGDTDQNGTDITAAEKSYSSVKNAALSASDKDWDGENGKLTWQTTLTSSAKLVRIHLPEDTQLDAGQTLKALITVQLPSMLDDTNTDAVIRNSFAYCYDGAGSSTATDMAAEPLPAGVKILATTSNKGTVYVNKTYNGSAERTFTFALYKDKPYSEGDTPIQTESVTLSGGSSATPVNAEVLFENLEFTKAAGTETKYYVYETDEHGIPIAQTSDLNYQMYVDDTAVAENQYSFVKKSLSMSKRNVSISFSNLVADEPTPVTLPTPGVEIFGPYYSDIATDLQHKDGSETNTNTTGRVDGSGTREEYYDNTVQDGLAGGGGSRINYSYENGSKVTHETDANGIDWSFSDGWGNGQGHTVATGFMARITGSAEETQSLTSFKWTVKSDPSVNSVYVKLTDAEKDSFEDKLLSKGYKLDKEGTSGAAFTDDYDAHGSKIYRIIKSNDTASITDLSSPENVVTQPSADEDTTIQGIGADTDDVTTLNGNEEDTDISFAGEETDITAITEDIDNTELAETEDAVLPLTWNIVDNTFPTLTLGEGATVYIGIVIDQLYDKNATAAYELNGTSGTSATSAAADNKGDQVNVPVPNNSSQSLNKGKFPSLVHGSYKFLH
jgi:uncharacterized repeat protein (TIGR01451 family)